MKHFLEKSGFTCVKDGIYELDLQCMPPAPTHLNLEINQSIFICFVATKTRKKAQKH
jgi:hypothetical protein